MWLSVASFVVGATAATVQVIVPFAAHHAPDRERGRIVGTVLGGLLVGALLARTFSGVFGAAFGWRHVYWVASGLMIGLAVVIRLVAAAQPALGLAVVAEADAVGRRTWRASTRYCASRRCSPACCSSRSPRCGRRWCFC